jgi:glycosyltransferase involved in cell wall biosynthesis
VAQSEVAIVIPALDEAKSLLSLLDDCEAQCPAPAEVIVVDAGSSDGTLPLLEERRERWPALRVVRAPGAGPGSSRNAGIRSAEAAVVATLDAGSRVAPDWLAKLSRPVLEDPEGSFSIGVIRPDAHTAFEQAAGWFTLLAFKPHDRASLTTRTFLPGGGRGYCFTRRTWEAVGGYRQLRWSEDKLFAQALLEAGMRMVVVEEAVLRWRPRGSLPEVYRQYWGYGIGDALSRVNRQNELIPLGLYAVGAALGASALRGRRASAAVLTAAMTAYFGIFVKTAARELPPAAVAWVPPLRATMDVAKIHGFLAATVARARYWERFRR